ncbi:hypothetical protein EJ04DRAFT_574262 [Polyplosphaeria fusca]|uniref:RRM domain-containing protein n=1 Tax=Polyplosphaeria fusca TaxID=682080 RepID=A0A9P4R260_9PLEO|nr:hypothetical protein EJ04DRAFT_574262 [Polyplosphaeria fusca]
MIPSPSPPQEAEHVRGKTLTPESPKPVHYPSPSNIPILEKQMDPMFNDPALSIGTPASFQSYPHPTQSPSAPSSAAPYYAEQQAAPDLQHAMTQASDYSQSTAYGSGLPSQAQDTTSIQSVSSQAQAPTAPYREANSTPGQDNRTQFSLPYDPNSFAALQNNAQPPQGNFYPAQANLGGTVNIQALLDTLSTPANSAVFERYATPSMNQPSPGQTPISSLPAAPNLPPRPPAQDKPTTHPNYNPNDDIRSYHPHSQKAPNAQFRGAGQLQPLDVQRGNNDNLSSARSNQSPSTPGYGRRQSADMEGGSPADEDERWPPEVNKLYEDFLDQERRFVTDGQWDQFPVGSRLFLGNLPTEKVTKRDIFHRFYRHGALAQISIKQAYGFVQFLDAASCHRALQAEQGRPVRGRKMHLEISKPQRNTKKQQDNSGSRRRSRSPDYSRGGSGPQSRGVDRYTGAQNAMSPRDRDNRRSRDEYRNVRSPSPPRGGRGNRGRDRSRDRYDGWRRDRSRSPRRYRSPSPRRNEMDDDLPLPHRVPSQVPDVQVLVLDDNLPRNFIRWVEDTFHQQGLGIDILILSQRLSEAAVVRRQILEGVLAIVKLNTTALAKGKISLQVFDRSRGADNVSFNEYADLEPQIAAALVRQSKQSQAQPVQPPAPNMYGQAYGANPVASPYANPAPAYPPTPTTNAAPNLSSMLSSLDPNGLSQLLGAITQNGQTSAAQAVTPSITPDLARLLAAATTPTQQPSYPPAGISLQGFPTNAGQNSTLASLLSSLPQNQAASTPQPMQTQSQPTPTSQPDMNEIMAQLAKYQR